VQSMATHGFFFILLHKYTEKRREIEIEMYCEERKLHWEVRMTNILGKLEMTKATTILRQREYVAIFKPPTSFVLGQTCFKACY
jgi:hypothetical protein